MGNFSARIENFCYRIHDPQTSNQIDAAGYSSILLLAGLGVYRTDGHNEQRGSDRQMQLF